MKDKLLNLKDMIFYIPRLIKFLYAIVKAILYIKKRLIKEKLLSKKKLNYSL